MEFLPHPKCQSIFQIFVRLTGIPWVMKVLGIPSIATEEGKKSVKMNHIASILSGLLENYHNGFGDGSNNLDQILTKDLTWPLGICILYWFK